MGRKVGGKEFVPGPLARRFRGSEQPRGVLSTVALDRRRRQSDQRLPLQERHLVLDSTVQRGVVSACRLVEATAGTRKNGEVPVDVRDPTLLAKLTKDSRRRIRGRLRRGDVA